MVLVLQHLLTALLQFFRRGQQVFLKVEDAVPGSEALQGVVPGGETEARSSGPGGEQQGPPHPRPPPGRTGWGARP
uniref:Uncharacterized protein n=1 Tax=Anas platyrhynchos platyrhynchos TaxID=8840 RepID=A0A493SWA8_ANAPP